MELVDRESKELVSVIVIKSKTLTLCAMSNAEIARKKYLLTAKEWLL